MTESELLPLLKSNAEMTEKALSKTELLSADLLTLTTDASLRTLFKAQQYSLMAGGKRIRPTLVLETCRMLNGNTEAALPLACAVEMIHTYSLIHDDLPCMDNDDLRRGRPTNHKVYGEGIATLAGDGLLTDAFNVIAMNTALSESARLVAVRILSSAAGSTGMVGGQVMDLEGETSRLSMEDLLKLHARKTGAIIRASVQLGAVAAGFFPDDTENSAFQCLTRYAECVGLSFQVVDDLLDVTADPLAMGKTLGKDATENKTTFLTYYSVDEARAYAQKLTEEACTLIAPFDKNGVLTALACYLAKRLF